MPDWLQWLWGKDIPNWLALFVSTVAVPILVQWWRLRTVSRVKGLDISVSGGTMHMNGNSYPCINMKFSNHTGAKIRISEVRISNPSSGCAVSPDAERDIVTHSHVLRFQGVSGNLDQRDVTINTDDSASTCLALTTQLSDEAKQYHPSGFWRFLRLRRFFVLSLTVERLAVRRNVVFAY